METYAAANFNTFVTKPGKYLAKLRTIDLPRGYKYIGPAAVEITAEEGKIIAVPTFILQARRFIIGRAFVDKNGNNTFDDDETPAKGIKIQIGNTSMLSEDDGSFSISTLPAGNYQIKVEPKTYMDGHLTLLNDSISLPEAGTVEVNIPYQR